MLNFFRARIFRLHGMLHALVLDPDRLDILLSMQEAILTDVIRIEEIIRSWKVVQREHNVQLKTARLPKDEANRVKQKLARLGERLDELSQAIYFLKCFGDGIAFLYLDKFALKQTFFETASIREKSSPGWFSGKQGLDLELEILREMIERGVPALLTDLTNTIRHGDVCVLVGPDPILIEAKSGGVGNSRAKRQLASLAKLNELFMTDRATDLRGFPEVTRRAHSKPEVTYANEMNACIELAQRNGFAVANPEPSIFYVAMYAEAESEDVFSRMNLQSASVWALNEFKSAQKWCPYSPFVLSISNPERVFEFMLGKLFLLVVFDPVAFEKHLNDAGLYTVSPANASDEGPNTDDYVIVGKIGTDFKWGIAHQLLARMAFEFSSPAWLYEMNSDAVEEHIKRLNS